MFDLNVNTIQHSAAQRMLIAVSKTLRTFCSEFLCILPCTCADPPKPNYHDLWPTSHSVMSCSKLRVLVGDHEGLGDEVEVLWTF